MHLPPLPSSSNSQVYVKGDVRIDPSAAIAPGVILQAAPDGKIIIAAGVCIGMGSILQAQEGTLEVESGAILGAGVLVVGKGKIGANACVGAIATIWNHSIEPWQVVPAGALLGDAGRQIVNLPSTSTQPPRSEVQDTPSVSPSTTDKEPLNGQVPTPKAVESTHSTQEDSPTEPKAASPASQTSQVISGQGNLNRLLKTLFPYDQSITKRLPEPEDD